MLLNPLSTREVFEIEEADAVAGSWLVFLFSGIVSLVFGALILSVDWSLDGLAAFVGTLFMLPIGIWALRRPGLTLAVVITLTGAWAIVNGAWQCLIAFEVRSLPRRLDRLRPAA